MLPPEKFGKKRWAVAKIAEHIPRRGDRKKDKKSGGAQKAPQFPQAIPRRPAQQRQGRKYRADQPFGENRQSKKSGKRHQPTRLAALQPGKQRQHGRAKYGAERQIKNSHTAVSHPV